MCKVLWVHSVLWWSPLSADGVHDSWFIVVAGTEGSPTLSVIFFYFHGSDSMEVRGSSWKWHGSWWKRRGSAMEARGSAMEVKIGFMEADGTSWNQNPTSMEVLT